MSVFRVEKTRDYTIMANHHLKDRQLSLKAKGLLSVMLSLPEEWDYTLKGLARISREGVDAIRECIRELERAGYVARTRQRNEQGHLKGMEYVIFEQPQPVETNDSSPEEPVSEEPVLESPVLENPTLEEPVLENPTQLNTYRSTTHSEKKKESNTQAENPYPSNPRDPWDVESIRQRVMRNIEYDCLADDSRFSVQQVNEVVDLVTETLCSRRETICIAGDEFPAGMVKDKLLRLNGAHIEYVLNCLKQNTTYVRNIRRYLLAALFNAPSTMDCYYTALVNHDLYGGGSRGRPQ